MAAKAAAHSYEKGRDKFMEKIVEDSDNKKTTIEPKKQAKTGTGKTTSKKQSKITKKTTNKIK